VAGRVVTREERHLSVGAKLEELEPSNADADRAAEPEATDGSEVDLLGGASVEDEWVRAHGGREGREREEGEEGEGVAGDGHEQGLRKRRAVMKHAVSWAEEAPRA
jgi:hypothetical protein